MTLCTFLARRHVSLVGLALALELGELMVQVEMQEMSDDDLVER